MESHRSQSHGLTTTFAEAQEAIALLRHHDIKAFVSPPEIEPADYTHPGDRFFLKLEKTRLYTTEDVRFFASLQDDGTKTSGKQRSRKTQNRKVFT